MPGASDEFAYQLLDACTDVVADGADRVDSLTCRVVELPVLVALPGEERAGVAAAHRDDDVRGLHSFGGENLRGFGGDVYAELGHRVHRDGVDLVGRHGSG